MATDSHDRDPDRAASRAADRTLAELLQLFDRERMALCAGDLALVAELGVDKIALVERIGTDPPDPARLAPLRTAAQRNARLLAAALAGLREGAGHLQVIRLGATGFSSYDRSGRPGHVAGTGPRSLERRA